MDTEQLQAQRRLLIRQRVRPMVNQYEVHTETPDGKEGEMVAFARQKRVAFKEQVTLYTDDSQKHVFGGFKARQMLDAGAAYDVTDATGTSVGLFRKEFGKSLLRSTWRVEQPGLGTVTGHERSLAVALLRRLWDAFVWPYHFDFTGPDGEPAFSVMKKFALRDRYVVDIADPRLDRRLVIAQAVALDALQAR